MHPRHRNTGNGFRSSSMGAGLASSQFSPEGSVRGHGSVYGNDYRNFNHPSGYGRGQGYPKSYQSSQSLPPTRRGGGSVDIFMEAGRLAAEYLVSQGLLPSSALSGKWQGGSLRRESSDFQELGPLRDEGRTSTAAPHSGHVGPDSGSGRRQLSDEYSSASRNHWRGRRRSTSFRSSSGSDWSGQDYSRSNNYNDRARASPDTEPDDEADNLSAYSNQQQSGAEVGSELQIPKPSKLGRKGDTPEDSGPELVKYPLPDDEGSTLKASDSDVGKDLPCEQKLAKDSDNLSNLDSGSVEAKNNTSINETEKHCVAEKLSVQNKAADGDSLVKQETDLLAFCRFAKFPTKTRSALACKVSKIDPISTVSERPSDIIPNREPEISLDSNSSSCALSGAGSAKKQDVKRLNSESSKPEAVEETGIIEELYPRFGEKTSSFTSQSFQQGPFWNESKEESCQNPVVFGRTNSMFEDRGQKRSLDESDGVEGNKKPREWIPLMTSKEDESFDLLKFDKTKVCSEENKPDDEVDVAADCVNSVDGFHFLKGGGEQCVDYAQEKQLFPNSFKICDLNLMEASDIHDNHENNLLLIFPSISETKRDRTSVDIDLSISNGPEFGQNGVVTGSKEIEIIDLEDDYAAQVDKSFHNADRKRETVFTGLDGFSNNAQNSGDMPDVQDGYGLMISELLGAEFPNCASVQGDINSMHNEMSLPNGEGALADDDLIYMSLGEIPLSMPEF